MKILDYIEEVKDKSLLELPFNEVDALCFAQSSYTLFEKYISDQDIITMNTAGKLGYAKFTDKKPTNPVLKDILDVTKALGDSKRFANAKLHDFVSILNEEDHEQFCAFQVDIDRKTTLVVFRGTDDTAIGWREDFEMAYSIVPAQKSAKDYVNHRLKPFRRYIYLGHSKGGNLAYYAALHAKTTTQFFITKVYSFDGPGINPKFYDLDDGRKIANRYEKFIPEFDIFGTIFDDGSDCKIIKSDGFTIFQHNAMSWLIEGNRLLRANSTTKESNLIKNGLADFVNSVSIEEREIFFNELFNAFDELKLNSIADITKAGLPAFVRAIKKIMAIDDNSKKTGLRLIKILTDATSSYINQTINETRESVTNRARQEADNIREFVDHKVNRIRNKQ